MYHNNTMKNTVLQEEDYKEPACVLCDTPFSKPAPPLVPIDRILAKYDDFMNRQDHSGAERHLKYWIAEAAACSDMRAEFSVRNEYMGFLRLQGRFDEAVVQADAAVSLIKKLSMTGSVTAGTCYLNTATVYDAAGRTKQALEFFALAEKEYSGSIDKNDPRFSGLYNNYGLALFHSGRNEEAIRAFDKAIGSTEDSSRGKLEQAISWLNKADVYDAAPDSDEKDSRIYDSLQKACDLLDDPTILREGYTAFVFDKCSQVFGYYGWFSDSKRFGTLSKEIYENLRNM